MAATDALIHAMAPAPGRQLPVRHQGCEAYRMFSNAQDGSRLETLYSCCADFGPLLLLFKAINGAIFGVFSLGLDLNVDTAWELPPGPLEACLYHSLIGAFPTMS